MQIYPNNGFLSYWKELKQQSSFSSGFLRFLHTAIRLIGVILKDAGVELFFLLIFWLIISKMGQGRDIIVSLFEPDGIYTMWRIFFTVLSVISLSVSMWIVPAFLFQLREWNNPASRSIFKEHLFFAHRVLPLIPFWLLAFVLFNQKNIGYLFLAFSALVIGLLFWFNHKIKNTKTRMLYASAVLILVVVLTVYFNMIYKETYTQAKIVLSIILYLLSFLMHFLYHKVDNEILDEHVQSEKHFGNSLRKYPVNSSFYIFFLLIHVVLITLLFSAHRLVLAPESIMLYIFSFYVFVVDLIVYLVSINPRVKLVSSVAFLVFIIILYLSPSLNLNVSHFTLDTIEDTTVLRGKERLNFEDRYALLKKQIDSNKSGKPYPIILVSGEGGGSRAGLWLSQNLINFDYYTNGKFRDHIFSISTVSGSSVGLSTLFSFWELSNKNNIDSDWLELPSKVYANNFVGSSVSGLLLTDFWKSVVPGPWVRDRNSILQDEEAYYTQKACMEIRDKKTLGDNVSIPANEILLKKDFMSFFYTKQNDSLVFKDKPLVFINTCRSNDGRRGIISPIKLNDDVFNDAIDIASYLYEDSVCDHTKKKLCSSRKRNISLGQACNTSELFPFFSAPAYIDSLGSFVDGGYHENSGLKTTLDVYLKLKEELDADKLDGRYTIYILYFKNGSGEKNLYKPMNSELPFTLPVKALSSQPFEGSASYFEEKAKFVNHTNTPDVQFITVQLDNKIIKDEKTGSFAERDPHKREIEQEILADLRTEDNDTLLNFPLARWLSKSVIKRMRLATFPLKANRSADDVNMVALLETINNMNAVNVEQAMQKLKPFREWGAKSDSLIKEQTELIRSLK